MSREQLARLALAWLGLRFGLRLVCSKPIQPLVFGQIWAGIPESLSSSGHASDAQPGTAQGPFFSQPAGGTMSRSTEMPAQVPKAAGTDSAQRLPRAVPCRLCKAPEHAHL